MKATAEHFGQPCIFIAESGARYIGMITRILKDGRVDAKIMFTDLGAGWELARKPWRKLFAKPPEVWLLDP